MIPEDLIMEEDSSTLAIDVPQKSLRKNDSYVADENK